jgi:hypothetical protein
LPDLGTVDGTPMKYTHNSMGDQNSEDSSRRLSARLNWEHVYFSPPFPSKPLNFSALPVGAAV